MNVDSNTSEKIGNNLYGFSPAKSEKATLSFELARYIATSNLLNELDAMAKETNQDKIVINSPKEIKNEKGEIVRLTSQEERLSMSSIGDLLKLQVHQNYLETKTNVLYNLGDAGLKTQNRLLSTRKS